METARGPVDLGDPALAVRLIRQARRQGWTGLDQALTVDDGRALLESLGLAG